MIYLAHHGIKGQKWGVRKYQNPDGSLTSEGRKRYGLVGSTKAYIKKRQKNVDRFYKESKNLGDDKTRDQMTKEERAIFDKADSAYVRRQKKATAEYKKDLMIGINDKRNRVRRTGQKVVKSILVKNANRRLSDIDFGTRKSNPWSEKPYNPYDYNWTERPSKRRNGPNI